MDYYEAENDFKLKTWRYQWLYLC